MPRLTGDPPLSTNAPLRAPALPLGPPNGHGPAGHELDHTPAESGWDLAVKLWRRRYLILAVAIACAGTGVLAASVIEPRYKAEAQVLVGGQQPSVIGGETAMAKAQMDNNAIRTEGHVISSRRMAARVSQDLGLAEDPDFFPEESGRKGLAAWLGIAGMIDHIRTVFDDSIDETTSGERNAKKDSTATVIDGLSKEDRTVSRVLSGLTVE